MARQEMGAAVSVERFFQFSLLGLVAAGYLAVAGSGYLDTATIALTAAGLILRALLICGVIQFDFSERTVTFMTVGYAAFYALDYLALSHSFLTSTVHLLFFLAVVKILTSKTGRDHLYTAVIAFLELVAAAILSVDFNFLLFLAVYLLFAIAALTSGEIRRALNRSGTTAKGGLKSFHQRLSGLTLSVALGILILTAGLFFLLPRTADAAFSHLMSHRIYLPGFSDRVTLGEIGEMKTSSRPMMHISIFSAERLPGLKWRGGVLTTFDGKQWSNTTPDQRLAADRGHVNLMESNERRVGSHISYDVELDAIDNDALFFAGTPEGIDVRMPFLLRDRNGVVRLGRRPPEGFRYEAYSLLEGPPESAVIGYPPASLDHEERDRDLQLPPALGPRVAELARQFTTGSATDLERARAVERHLRSDYSYTLQLPDRESPDPISDFLFTRRKGHCEYFASAMTVMLRTLGIPSRMAIGFQSGVYNPLTDLWLIRASDAHTWVEAWIPGHGWSSFDPTPPDTSPQTLGVLAAFGLYLDAANTFWRDWVLSYDPTRQGTLVDRLEQKARGMGIRWFDSLSGAEGTWDVRLSLWFQHYGLRIGWVLLTGFWIWYVGPRLIRILRVRRRVQQIRRGYATIGDATLIYQRMLQILHRHGYQKPAWFTPVEFAASVPPGSLQSLLAEFTATYNSWRFGGHTEMAPQLGTLLDRLDRQERA